MKKRVLYLSSDNLVLYEWNHKELLTTITLKNDNDDCQRLKEIVRGTPEIVTYLLVDITEEEYYNGVIAHVSYRNRKTYLARQISKEFRGAIYKFGKILGKDSFHKKKDAVFFSALTDSDLISKWVDALTTEKVSVAAIYSFPIISEILVNEILSDQKFTLLVTRQISGLRLSFFQGSNLKISRLTSITNKTDESIAQLAISEIEKTTQYLKRKRLLFNEEELDISILGDSSFLKEVHNIVEKTDLKKFKFFSEGQLAKELAFEETTEKTSIVWILSNFLCMKKIENHYATQEHRRFTRLRQLIFPLKAASVFVAAISLSWAVNIHFDSIILGQNADQAKIDIDVHQNTFNRIFALQPTSPVPAKEIEQGLITLEELKNSSTTPVSALLQLSEIITKYPELRVEKIVWRMDEREVKSTVEKVEEIIEADSLESTEQIDDDPDDQVVVTKTVEVARLIGTIAPFDGNYRRATSLVSNFVERLNSMSTIKSAVAIALPLNAKSEASMSGNVATKPNETLSAKFEVEALFEKGSLR